MKQATIATFVLLAFAFPPAVLAQAAKEADRKADRMKEEVAQHRAMAAAHEKAARCLEAGKPEKECHEQLAKDCKGIGIGKHCGMKHRH